MSRDLEERVAALSMSELERIIGTLAEECRRVYRRTQKPAATYEQFEWVTEIFDQVSSLSPRALGKFHLLLANLLINGFASPESVAVARGHATVALDVLARRARLYNEHEIDTLRYAIWLRSIADKMLGETVTAHDDLIAGLRDHDLKSAGSIFGVSSLVRQLALIEQDKASFAALAAVVGDLPVASGEFFYGVRRLAEERLNAGDFRRATPLIGQAMRSFVLARRRLEGVDRIALLKNVYHLLLAQRRRESVAVGAAALHDAKRLGLHGQVMQIHALASQFEEDAERLVLPTTRFSVELTGSGELDIDKDLLE